MGWSIPVGPFLVNFWRPATPIGTAYAVWVGIGTVGTALLGIALHGEVVSPGRAVFLVLLLVSIAGLKLTTPTS